MSKYIIDNHELYDEWDEVNNSKVGLYPEIITLGSNKKVWWKCKKGHRWQASVTNRAKGRGCPYCSNKYILSGENDLGTTHPYLKNEWNFEKNTQIDIYNVSSGSGKKVWWKCKNGHEWQAIISSRVKGSKCPYCSNRKVLKGYNDLESRYPKVSLEWNYNKNENMTPDNIVYGSNKKVWWRCSKCNHEWKAQICTRTISGTKCPKCEIELKKIRNAERSIAQKSESLEELCPELMGEWAYDLNEILPSKIKKGSSRKVWWRCRKGHIWKAIINNRALHHTGCPECNKEYHISFPEKAVAFYLSMFIKNVEENYRPEWLQGKELDIYLSDFRVAIEYDGEFAHRNIKRDIEKDEICLNNKVHVIHIRQKGCPKIENNNMTYYELNDNGYDALTECITWILKNLNVKDAFIDIERDKSAIYEYMDIQEKRDSLNYQNPKLAQEWNKEKNGYLKPIHVSIHSNKIAWWKCEKGHEWQAQINSRSRGRECPYCKGRYIIEGETDLCTTHPEIVKEWNYKKNGSLSPNKFSKGSCEKVWWKCEKGHEWKAAIYSRVNGNDCPICSGNQLLKEYNDLLTLYPWVKYEWDYEKNDNLLPQDVHANARRKVWWHCKKGHEYEAAIYHRTGKKGTGCPICNNRQLLVGYNDLATVFPHLVEEWNREKNNFQPSEVITGAAKKVWWRCKKGHEWESLISSRCSGVGCPICSNKKVATGINDLLTIYPEIKKEWDYDANIGLLPTQITPGSSKTVAWKCIYCGYKYKKKVNQKIKYPKCPICKKESLTI